MDGGELFSLSFPHCDFPEHIGGILYQSLNDEFQI